MQRISTSKNQGVAEVVEEIISATDEEITLVVPRDSELGSSESNFRLIKREADVSGKSVFVESVDEDILSFAKSSGLRATHSLFDKEKKPDAFMDIIPSSGSKKAVIGHRKSKKTQEKEPIKLHIVEEDGNTDDQEEDGDETEHSFREEASTREWKMPRINFSFSGKRAVVILAIVLFFGAVGLLLSYPFARATIQIDFEKVTWVYEGVMTADISVSSTNVQKSIIPAELFTTEKNMTHLFLASGKDRVERRAKGTIWIYNAYSSSPQVLVATTRFEAPDGKVFRIVNQITVPGAEIKDGKIIPSSIEVDIVADKAGTEYNVGAVKRLSVPGFKGSPRFDGFYGEIRNPTSGGFIGEKPVPTSKDVDEAKARVAELLEIGLRTNFSASAPDNFKILDDAIEIEIKRISVDSDTNEEGRFSVFGEATMRVFGFRGSDVTSFLAVLADNENPDSDFKELSINYSNVKPDFDGGKISFSTNADSVLWPEFSADKFISDLAGKKIDEVRSKISTIDRLVGAKVSVWPIWLRSVPTDESKIRVVVN